MAGDFEHAEEIDLLRSTHLFASLEPAQMKELAASCCRVSVPAGHVVMREGESADSFYAVLSGRLRATQSVDGREPGEIVLGEVHRGEHVGEAAVLACTPRIATVTALTDAQLIELSSHALTRFLDQHPSVQRQLEATFAYRVGWAARRRIRPPREELLSALQRFVGDLAPGALAALENEVEWHTAPRGEVLMHQGDPGDCLYIVVSGRLEVFGHRDDGSELSIAEIGPGESVGEMALISREARVASVRVLRDAELLRLSVSAFDRVLAAAPRAMSVFTGQLSARLGRAIRARSLVAQLRATRLAAPEECARIARCPDLVLRNLQITQMYHRLSLELTLLLGSQNANWCTFACHASKTAGYAVRGEELPLYGVWVRLRHHPRTASAVRRVENRLAHSPIGEHTDAIIEAVSAAISVGNRKVFEELGPVFARFVTRFHQEREYDRSHLREFLQTLTPGSTEQGGQALLAEALTHYYDAAFEPEPKKTAELILLGNIKIGLHEQTRLQPQIVEALEAPFRLGAGLPGGDALRRLLVDRPPGLIVSELLHRVDRLDAQLRRAASRAWRRVLTRSMMSLRLPYGHIRLGQDLPCLPDEREHADMLQTLTHPELARLVARFDNDAATLSGSRASDWGSLDERMNFIVNLFRSRQKSLELFSQPFLLEQQFELACNRVPSGRL